MDNQKSDYRTIKSRSEGFFKDRGSKFYAYAFPVSNEVDVKQALQEIKKEHHSARHHCYAYRINPRQIEERSNDDGEPRHSAGSPILGQLKSYKVVNTLVIVVRYFGGTKLGVSGLINAYKSAAHDALNNTEVLESEFKAVFKIFFEYPDMNNVMRILKAFDANMLKQEMQMMVTMVLEIREDQLSHIQKELILLKSLTFNIL